ncbi:hypothetical protein ON064_16840 [Planococcus sp. A6]|nr:hypothetical protein [Planococcus sp. A6]MDE0584695.1 hypothetical protein [Planococcus sp. A6]
MEKHKIGDTNDEGKVWICTPYITKNGVRIYPKGSKVFCFWAKPRKGKN